MGRWGGGGRGDIRVTFVSILHFLALEIVALASSINGMQVTSVSELLTRYWNLVFWWLDRLAKGIENLYICSICLDKTQCRYFFGLPYTWFPMYAAMHKILSLIRIIRCKIASVFILSHDIFYAGALQDHMVGTDMIADYILFTLNKMEKFW